MEDQVKSLDEKFEFKRLDAADFEETWDFVAKYFFHREPLWSTMQVSAYEISIIGEDLVKICCEHEVSLGAYNRETSKLIAVGLSCLGKFQETRKVRVSDEKPLQVRQVEESLRMVMGDDISSTLGTEDYLEFLIVCCHPDWTKMGLATELCNRSLQIAKEKGAKKVFTVATNFYTQFVTKKCGFHRQRELFFSDYVDPITGKKIYENMAKPHTSMTLEVKDLE